MGAFSRGLAVLAACAACAACGGPAASPTKRIAIPIKVQKITFPNGLTVFIDEDHRSPVVSVNVSYQVGGRDDPPRRSGLAHLFEHMTFQGSAHVAKGEFARYLETAGARTYNGYTTDDRTVYEETVPSNQLDLVLWLESERMGFSLAQVDPTNFDRERSVVKNERRQNYERRSLGYRYSFIREALFPGDHPYHRNPIGTPEDLDATTIDDLRAFGSKFYVPANASISIVGDCRREDAEASVNKFFGTLPRTAAPVKREPVPSALRAEKRITIDAPKDDRTLTLAWATPPVFAPGDAALTIAIETVQGVLYYWLVKEHEYATSVSTYAIPGELASVVELNVVLTPSAQVEKVLEIVDVALSDAAQAEVPRRWVAKEINEATAGLVFHFEEFAERAERYNTYYQAVGTPIFLPRLIARYDDLDRAQVDAAKVKYLTGARVVALVRPNESAPTAGRLIEGAKW